MNDELEQEQKPHQFLLIAKREFQNLSIKFLSLKKLKEDLLKSVLIQIAKTIVPNVENPLFLSDFLTQCLDYQNNLSIQILGLRAIFILLEKHGLDYPNYYKRLYALLLPQYQKESGHTISIFTLNLQEKSRFLRLLDLSLRSPSLPSKIIAAFMKRLSRVMMAYGVCFSQPDKMYVVSLIANLIKRHPRTVRLIHRKQKLYRSALTFESDPFKHEETDPLKAKALKSSLWEIDYVMKFEFDEQVRHYAKLFKGDISRKTNYFKCEQFAQIDPLDSLMDEITAIDVHKEYLAINKALLLKHSVQV